MRRAHRCGCALLQTMVLLSSLSGEAQDQRTGLEEEIRYLKAESLVLTATRTLERAEPTRAPPSTRSRVTGSHSGSAGRPA